MYINTYIDIYWLFFFFLIFNIRDLWIINKLDCEKKKTIIIPIRKKCYYIYIYYKLLFIIALGHGENIQRDILL